MNLCDHNSQTNASILKSVAAKALLTLLDGRASLFLGRIALTEGGFRKDSVSQHHTVVALLGLLQSGLPHSFDLEAIEEAIFRDTRWVKGIGDLGILIRFAAECKPNRLASIINQFDLENALNLFLDGRQAQTAPLACFLAGISHARLSSRDVPMDLTDVAVDTYRLLKNNQGAGGIFVHAGCPSLLQQPFSNRFGTFADQADSIYALVTFARAFDIEEPLADALNCANVIRALQGDKGQWWFLYDKRSCRVVNHYPVRSIHQDGLAPMALITLEEATGQKFQEAVCKGLSWIAGANELGADLRDLERGVIWDSIAPKSRIASLRNVGLSIGHKEHTNGKNLQVCFEARPDHFGWLLYALSRFGFSGDALVAKVVTVSQAELSGSGYSTDGPTSCKNFPSL